METVQVYKTSDNKLFEDLASATHHENFLKHKPDIVEFMNSNHCEYKGSAHQTMIEKTLVNWIFWKENKK